MHDSVKDSNNKHQKPKVLAMYDHTKGGVDVVDLVSTNHSTRMKSKILLLNALAFILDTSYYNGQTILQDKKFILLIFFIRMNWEKL